MKLKFDTSSNCSRETLERRVAYGGRKGRRAKKRLLDGIRFRVKRVAIAQAIRGYEVTPEWYTAMASSASEFLRVE